MPNFQTLSLEEKQKLAKQQEQQRMMKATKPLEAKSSLGKTGTLSQGPKDLTSSLLQSNLSNTPTKQTLNSSLSGNPVSAFSSSSMNSASPFLSSNSLTSSSQSGFNTNASTGNLGQQKKVDLSSFDTLLSNGSPKPKNSMNEFAQIRTSTPNSGSLLGRGMGNGPNMMGTNQGMMGTNQGMVGINQGMMGTNQNMIGTNRGMMGTNQGMIGNMSMNASGMMGNQHFPSQQSMMGQSMQTGNMTPGFGGQQLVSGGYPQPMNSGFGHGGSGFQGQMFQTPGIGGQMMQPQSMTGQSLMSNTSSTSRSSLDDLLG
ncbi:hypothetical protein DPMN_012228 [Dreissena polymorpha]|uniref:Uncharacterized protein n=1 Tax=Dreissena polymorpha TaxID=45954 RepID=A0A9D4N1Y8_DREPO|nr:hypothetical protein DPMN_012228 [Dreissena polymorpha]